MADSFIRLLVATLLLAAGATSLFAAIRACRPRPATLCPGRVGDRAWRFPLTWLYRGGCGYDLSMHCGEDVASARCPECGRSLGGRRFVRTRYRWRAWRTAATLAACGVLVTLGAALRDGWPTLTPTLVLVESRRVHERPQLEQVHREMDDELDRRVGARALSAGQIDRLAAVAAENLRDDDREQNANRAMSMLRRLGAAAVPTLERCLESDDWQQRQLAASLLRDQPGYRPTDALLRVTVEGLRDDTLPFGYDPQGRWRLTVIVCNAREAVEYLTRNAHLAELEPHLVRGTRSADVQQRLLCALVAGRTAKTHLLPELVPMLIECLRHNDVDQDAAHAHRALIAFGAATRPYIEPYRDSDDAQQRRLVRDLLYRFRRSSKD